MSSDHSKSDSPASSKVSLLSTDTTSSTYANTAKQKGTKHYLSSLAKYASGTRGEASSDPAVGTSGSVSPTPSSASTPLPGAPSQTTLVNPTPARQPPPKDYEAAFGALATSFGTAGHAPVVVKKAKKKVDAQPSAAAASTSTRAAPRK